MHPASTRPSFVIGLAIGAAAILGAGLLAGVGAAARDGSQFVTSSPDGRNAYLWESDGGSLRFVGAAHAEKGKGEDHADKDRKDKHTDTDDAPDADKPEKDAKGKPEQGDKGKPADKGRGKK